MPAGESLERLYDDHATSLYAFALSLTHREADSRDLLQDLFVKLARQPGALDGVHDERAFLLRWMRNAAVDLFRRRQSREHLGEALAQIPASPFAPAPDPDDQAFRNALAEALFELPEDQRIILQLKLWEGLTFEAIAKILNIPPNTAASRYRYGLDKIRHRLRPLYEELR